MIENLERSAVDKTTDMFGTLSINSRSCTIDTNKMEWQLGGANLMKQYDNARKLDSDDESDDNLDPEEYIKTDPEFRKNPLKILASRSEVAIQRKQIQSYAATLSEKGDAVTENSQSDLGTLFYCITWRKRHRTHLTI